MTEIIHPHRIPNMVYANEKGEILDFPELKMAGRTGNTFVVPKLEDLIPLPAGSELFVLPDRLPIGYEQDSKEPVKLATNPTLPDEGVQAVAAFMAPAHTGVHIAAYEKEDTAATTLPLFAYTAVGWLDDIFWVSGFRSDNDPRQEPTRFTPQEIEKNTRRKLKHYHNNRLAQHLGKCSLTYGCPAAVNFYMGKWEAPLPTAPYCNASCLGCISLQPSGCCPSTQERINFTPTPEEIAEIAVDHLKKVKGGIVSFGQGCEGEPLTQSQIIEQAIIRIRQKTATGTINLNTNGSLPEAVEKLAKAGLDSIRISINSARYEYHKRYYRPNGFDFNDVMQSIDVMKDMGRHVSLNYFILPGFTDEEEEFAAFCELITNHQPDLIQLRNLNMDPDWYLEELAHNPTAQSLGIRQWHQELQERFPKLKFGYFNPAIRD